MTLDEKTLKESLDSVRDYLNNVSDDELLDRYHSVATYEGVTVDDYLEASKATCEVFICDESYEQEAIFVTAIFDISISAHDSANDDSYSSVLSPAA